MSYHFARCSNKTTVLQIPEFWKTNTHEDLKVLYKLVIHQIQLTTENDHKIIKEKETLSERERDCLHRSFFSPHSIIQEEDGRQIKLNKNLFFKKGKKKKTN